MSYPLSDTFATAPATGYTTVLGGMSATHNGAQQSIDISAPTASPSCASMKPPRRFLVRGRCRVADRPKRPQAHRPVDDDRQWFRGYRFAHLDGGGAFPAGTAASVTGPG